MNISNLAHKVPHLPKRKQSGFDRRMMHPAREWLLGVFFFLLSTAIGGAISVYTFLRYTDITVTEVKASQTDVSYNQGMAQKALGMYQVRKNAFRMHKETNRIEIPAITEVASSTSAEIIKIPEGTEKDTNTSTTTKNSDRAGESQLVN